MATLYLTEQGAVVHERKGQLEVEQQGQLLARVPLPQVEQVVVWGNVGFTTPALRSLLAHGIDAVFCDASGGFRGRLLAHESPLGELRVRQLQVAADPARALRLARAIVRGKGTNQRILLQRARRRRPTPAVEWAVEGIGAILHRLGRADSLEALRGLEGEATSRYLRAFASLLPEDVRFERRQRRPPPDPANALLSYASTLLAAVADNAVRRVGLDPYVGFLHPAQRSRPSLALDLMEEFRPLVAESVVLRQLATRRLRPEHFEPDPDGGGVRLTAEGRRRFLEAWEGRLATLVQGRGGRRTYRATIELQARELARAVRGPGVDYRPFVTR